MRLQRPAAGNVTGPFTATHRALDFGWGKGTDVRAAASGELRIEHNAGYGLRVFIRHDDQTETEYSHLSTVWAREGHVEAGALIAAMGNSGTFAQFVHLHFAVWVRGTRVDPAPYFLPATETAGKPIDAIDDEGPIIRRKKLADMAWMRSQKTGAYYLTSEFTVERDVQNPRQVSDELGFDAESVPQEVVKRSLARAETNRALLVKQIADTVLSGIRAGITVTAAVDAAAIARRVEAQLADEFAAVPADVADEIDDRERERLG